MDVDEGSKGSSMDVDSLMKDDIMDIDLEDHMDIDNELMSNKLANGLETINEEDESAAPVEKSQVLLPSKETEVLSDNKNSDRCVFEADKSGIIVDEQKNSAHKEVISRNVLKKTEGGTTMTPDVIESENKAQQVNDFVTEKENVKIVDLNEDLIKFNDTIEESSHNETVVPEKCKSNHQLENSKKDEELPSQSLVNASSLNSSVSCSAADVLSNAELTNFLSTSFDEEANADTSLNVKANESLSKISVPVEQVSTTANNNAEIDVRESAICQNLSDENKAEGESCHSNCSSLTNSIEVTFEVIQINSASDSEKSESEEHADEEKRPDGVKNVISIDLEKPSSEDVNEEELLKSCDEDKQSINEEELVKGADDSKHQSKSEIQEISLLNEKDKESIKENNIASSRQIVKITELMEIDESQSKSCEEAMDVDVEENFDVEMSGPGESVSKGSKSKETEEADAGDFLSGLDILFNENKEKKSVDNSEKESRVELIRTTEAQSEKILDKEKESVIIEGTSKSKESANDSRPEDISKVSECESENREKTWTSELAEVCVSGEGTAGDARDGTDPFTDIEPGEVICRDLEDCDNNNAPFGIVATVATIAPNEFENLVSAGNVNDDQSTEENIESNVPHIVPKLADLAMKTIHASKGEETLSKLNKAKKNPIQIKTIKQEKLDFNFKESSEVGSYGQFQNQIEVKQDLDLLENASQGSRRADRKNKTVRKRRKGANNGIRKIMQKRLEARKRREKRMQSINSDRDGLEGTSQAAAGNSRKEKKKHNPKGSLTTEKILKRLQIDMNDRPVATKRKLRSSLNETSSGLNESSPNRKRTRLSLPDLSREKRALRATGEATPNVEPGISKKEVESTPRRRNVAVKSTTPRVQYRKDFKIVEKKCRNVARKRGQPYFKNQSEPAPIFVDTNFGSQNIDMFINENEDDEPVMFYDSRECYDYKTTKIRKCKVVIKRMPVIERLIPVKKSTEKIEPNICELCEPKRVFLSKSSLAEHIKNEHISHSSGTISPQAKSEVKVPSEMNSCTVCNKLFHSKNRLAAHVKTCKPEISNKIVNQVPGVDLSNLGRNITISILTPEKKENDKKEVRTSNSIKHVCDICNRRFLMASGLKSHMKTHKNSEKNKSSLPKPGKLNLTCNICDKAFKFCSDLVEHISFHSLTSEKEKDILLGNLKKISNIQINLESVEDSESSESEIDNLTDDDSSDYSYRVKIKTTPKIYFPPNKCFECGRVFTIKAVYERHVGLISKISNLKDQSKCPVCDLEIKFRCKLGAHLETHKPQTEEQLICKKCNKTFRCENNLIRHELEHEGKLKVNCQYCNYSFHSMSDLYAHQEECKFKCSEYKCNLCKRVFTAKWRLDLHMKTDEKHGTDPQQPNTYFCDQCGREFKHLSVLKRHVDSRCGTEPLYECPDCDKKYFSQGSLASHKRTQHSTEKNFMCQYCSKDFFTKHQLHRHELRHNPDIRPYRCKYPNCEKTYRQPDSLRAHECEHTGLYPYVCEFCGLQFSNVKSLKLHRKSSNHWSDVEPNKVVTQACRQKHSGKKFGDEQKFLEGKQVSEEEEIDPEGHEDEPKNLVINESQYEGVYNDRITLPQNVPQYSNLQPFTVNHLMQSQQSSVLVQSAHPLATYTQAIENYFVIASQQEPMAGSHHHPMMN